MIVDTANFIAIMEAAMEGECKLCFKQGGECKRCKLFKALSVEAARRPGRRQAAACIGISRWRAWGT